jgi:hypothetical protein
MRKKTKLKIFVMLWGVTILISVVVGKLTASSFVDNVELEQYLSNKDIKIAYCVMGYDPDTNVGYLNNEEVQSLDDLLVDKDTIVAKVILSKNFQRKIYLESIFSQVEIVECESGNLKKGEKIEILEPVDCGANVILCTDGYSMMQEGKEYIVFLKPLKNTYYGHSKYIYAPNSTLYSKFPTQPSTPHLFRYEELEEPEKLYSYEKMKDEEVYLYDKKEFNKYLKLKKEVLERFK